MPKAYSLDLRERVVGFVEDGHSRRAAAVSIGVETDPFPRRSTAVEMDGHEIEIAAVE